MQTYQIPHNFKLRPYQNTAYQALKSGCKRAITVWPRRAGKDKFWLNYLAIRAYSQPGNYYYYFPFKVQARAALWDGVDKTGFRFLDHFPYRLAKNDQQMKLTLPSAGGSFSIFQIIGTDDPDTIVGPNPRGCVFSEFSLQKPEAWELTRPILAENDGWAGFNFTPRGKNHAYKLLKLVENQPGWFTEVLSLDQTKHISMEALELERQSGMSERLIRQEFYCDFNDSLEGAYWSQEWLDQWRVEQAPELRRIIVAVDPAATSAIAAAAKKQKPPDETGVCVAGIAEDKTIYVLYSAGFRDDPATWARKVVLLREQFGASEVIVETNQGGEMVRHTIQAVDRHCPVKEVRASKGKESRAQGFPTLFQNGHIRLVGHHAVLEDQLTTFPVACEHDDRLDAMVWALTELVDKRRVFGDEYYRK